MLHSLLRTSTQVARHPRFRSQLARAFSDLPDHEVVGLPALSPTMEAGTIGSWNVKEGDEYNAGDVIAEIETDKATMGFEAQDPGVVAKILVQPGQEIAVGTPIMVIVDDAEDTASLISSFSSFSAPAEPAPEAAAPTPPPPPPAPPPPAPTPAPAPVAAAPVAPPTVADPPASAPPPPAASIAPAQDGGVVAYSPRWGTMAKKSALAHKLAQDQKDYISKYGSTGQAAIA